MKRLAIVAGNVTFGCLMLGVGIYQLRECVFPGAEAQRALVALVVAGVSFGLAYKR